MSSLMLSWVGLAAFSECCGHRLCDSSFSPGMPFNQLGTLAGSKYYNVEAMYCYLRW